MEGYWQRLHPSSSIILCYMTYRAVEGALSYRIETFNGHGVVTEGLRAYQPGKVIQQGVCYGLVDVFSAEGSFWRVKACTDTDGTRLGLLRR